MEVQDAQVRLRDLFREALDALAGEDRRLVFFIDDLDRCGPEKVVDLLEKVRLFMYHEPCVFVIGVDPVAVEQAIQEVKQYQDPQIAGQYLEKMVQYAFDLPPVESAQRRHFVVTTLRAVLRWRHDGNGDPAWARPVADLWQLAFDDPEVDASVRLIKRTVNTFAVDHVIGSARLGERYDPVVMAVLSAIKSCYRGPFLRLRRRHAARADELWRRLFVHAKDDEDKMLASLFCREGDRWKGAPEKGHEPDDPDRLGWGFVQAVQALRQSNDSSYWDETPVLALAASGDSARLGHRVEEHFRLAGSGADRDRAGKQTSAESELPTWEREPPASGVQGSEPDEADVLAADGSERLPRGSTTSGVRPSLVPVRDERLERLPGLVDYRARRPATYADLAAACARIVEQGADRLVRLGGIDWRVLEPPGETGEPQALLLADRVIGTGPYNKAQVAMTWERCDLRGWLNGPFLDSLGAAFQSRVLSTEVQNGPNPTWDTDGGDDAKDHVFLLSMEEAAWYLAKKKDVRWKKYRKSGWFGREQVEKGLATADEDGGAAWWWLRSPGGDPAIVAVVTPGGYLFDVGYRRTVGVAAVGGVRRALWLNLESSAPEGRDVSVP